MAGRGGFQIASNQAPNAPGPASKGHWLAVLALAALGVVLRVRGLTAHEPWIDEYGTWWAIAGDGWAELWRRVLAIQGQSPFYYAVVRVSVDALGAGALGLRLPSLVFGSALPLLGYLLGLRLSGDRRVALAALAAFALDERLLFYARDARPYALALLCSVASFCFYLGAWRRGDLHSRVGWVAATAAAFYAHYLFGVVVLVQGFHSLVQRPLQGERTRAGADALTVAALGLACAPGALQLAGLYARRQALDWVPPSDGTLAGIDLLLGMLDLRVLLATGLGVLAVWTLNRRALCWPLRSTRWLLLLWLGLPVLLFQWVPPLFGVNLLHPRYLLPLLPAIPIGYAILVGAPPAGRLAWLPLATFVCASGFFRVGPALEGRGHFGRWYHDQQWQRATQVVARGYRSGELVLYATKFIELDDVASGAASALTTDFSAWPIRAHLPPESSLELRALPYTDSPENRRRVVRALREGQQNGGVWIVGLDPAASRAARLARRQPGLKLARDEQRGIVRVVHLVRRGYGDSESHAR